MSESRSQAAGEAADPTPTLKFKGSKAPAHDVHDVMNFDQLIRKVEQAEDALEADERAFVANWRQLKASWRVAWTPGRIVVAGLASGFLAGRLDPAKLLAKGGGLVQIFSMISGFAASASAQSAAGSAEQAAESAEDVADSIVPPGPPRTASAPARPAARRP